MSLKVKNLKKQKPIWRENKKSLYNSNLASFIRTLSSDLNLKIDPYNINTLHNWSISSNKNRDQFWLKLLEFSKINYEQKNNSTEKIQVVQHSPTTPPFQAKWFPNIVLNFARNILSPAFEATTKDKSAIISYNENGEYKTLSYESLRESTERVAKWLTEKNFNSGDRLACITPNIPEAIVSMLGTASIGGIFSSASPELGITTLIERFKQIEPKVLVISDGYIFKGEKIDVSNKIAELIKEIPSIQQVIIVEYIKTNSKNNLSYKDIFNFNSILATESNRSFQYENFPFDHPLYILFSSGTTGAPKCIVHGAGRVLLEHYKELALHTDLKPQDIIFYQTTTSWMMWNWLVSSLMLGTTIVLYDGSPLANNNKILWEIAEKEKITIFGTNAKYLSILKNITELDISKEFKLTKLKTLLSTGSPLLPDLFDFIQQKIKPKIQISSISGGTDIIGCFALGSPISPVYRGELQTKSLALDVDVVDEQGNSIVDKEGELICKGIFPTMPLYFWNDKDNEKYIKAYWKQNSIITKDTNQSFYWHHGDYVTQTSRHTMIFHGRSDTTLNPGGVRIGTAEIYSVIHSEIFPEIEDSVVVAQSWQGDQRVILFVQLKQNLNLTTELQDRIKNELLIKGSRYHIPKLIIQVSDIPKTHNNKVSEQVVTEIVNGRVVKNLGALKNAECLREFVVK